MPPDQSFSPFSAFVPFVLIFVIFYFLLIRPDKQRQKRLRDQIAGLKKNDQVVTSGGIHATVVNVKPSSLIVRIDDSVKIEIDKEAVARMKDDGKNGSPDNPPAA